MPKVAVIGGSGLADMSALKQVRKQIVETPFGEPSSPLLIGEINDREVVFLPRHGNPHTIPPHRLNYRANIYALKEVGVEKIIAVNAVGGITERMAPEVICLPDQVIDYTYGREHTFLDGVHMPLDHIDFSSPFCAELTEDLARSCQQLSIECVRGGVYGCTQGPRLETAAEITRLKADGCDLVGMTLMPEAALARELKLAYSSICLIVNWAAGCTDEEITMDEINRVLAKGIQQVVDVLAKTIDNL